MNPLILNGITKSFPGFDLGPINLELEQGYVTGLVGANGAGKTTLLKIALGLVHPDAGTSNLIPKQRVGVIFDVPSLPPQWRIKQIPQALAPLYDQWDDAAFQRIADWGALDPSKRVRELSRGMGMKLQLAISLAHGAELLLFDEPTSGLDPLARSELLDMVSEFMLDERHTVLFSSHITTDIEKIADYLVVVSSGQIVAQGELAAVLDGYRIVRGGASSLSTLRPFTVGLREHAAGWESLMLTENTATLPGDVVVEAPTVEQLVVALAKEGRHA